MAKKRKKKRQDEDFDDLDLDAGDDADEAEDKDEKPFEKYRARNDAYTGMLAISLFALIGGSVLLYLDFSKYDFQTKPPGRITIPPVGPDGSEGGGAQTPQNPPGGNPVPPNPGGNPMPPNPGGNPMPPNPGGNPMPVP
jgi:hypothetical protein